MIFQDTNTGDLYTCCCFDGYYDIHEDIIRFLSPQTRPEPYLKLKSIPNICHLCSKTMPLYEYGNHMYFSVFMTRFLPYHELFRRKYNLPLINHAYKTIEDELRIMFDFPIGKKLLQETILFNFVKMLYPNDEIIRHYRGRELEKLEIDIYIPSIKLGIEFQGKQHTNSISFFGGDKGLSAQQKRDKKKKNICKKLGIKLVFFYEDKDELSLFNVKSKLF